MSHLSLLQPTAAHVGLDSWSLTSGSVLSLKPAHKARRMEGVSSRPRYWLVLMITVGSRRILAPPQMSLPSAS